MELAATHAQAVAQGTEVRCDERVHATDAALKYSSARVIVEGSTQNGGMPKPLTNLAQQFLFE